MTNRIATLPPEARERGAITLSAGNAGQAYAWAGRAAGVPVTVVMPAGAVRSKVEACLGYGARVVLHGAHVGETFAEMERIRDAEGLTFVHPFDDPAVIAGNGTAGLELLDDVPDVDVVVVGVGGGGLICGRRGGGQGPAAGGAGHRGRAGAVQRRCRWRSSGARSSRSSRRASPTALGRRSPGAWTLAMAQRHVDDIVLLDDPTILAGLRFALERHQAGPRAGRRRRPGGGPRRARSRSATASGSRVVLSGGNVEVSRLGELLAAAGTLPGADA